jgi:predicted TIM-barrel fold metal-dependent hydrolase
MAGSAFGLAAAAFPSTAFPHVPAPLRRIDVHHHFLPPLFEKVATERGLINPMVRGLSVSRSLAEMDRNGIATAMLSIPGPGASIGDPELARRIARDANEHAARVAGDHKGRFGVFATLPLPDVEGSLVEAVHALDALAADGVQMWTSYGDFWLGDPRLTPLLEELNRRKTIVFTHPAAPDCCAKLLPEAPITMIEYGTDTTRTIASLVLSGATSRFPDIRWIFCHAGGTMPFLQERFVLQGKQLGSTPQGAMKIPHGVIHELRRLYYDTAQSANPYALGPLARLVPATQILMGSDYPYRAIADNLKGLAECGLFDAAGLDAIERANAARLLPRFA